MRWKPVGLSLSHGVRLCGQEHGRGDARTGETNVTIPAGLPRPPGCCRHTAEGPDPKRGNPQFFPRRARPQELRYFGQSLTAVVRICSWKAAEFGGTGGGTVQNGRKYV